MRNSRRKMAVCWNRFCLRCCIIFLCWKCLFCRQIVEIRNLFLYFCLIVSKCVLISVQTRSHVEKTEILPINLKWKRDVSAAIVGKWMVLVKNVTGTRTALMSLLMYMSTKFAILICRFRCHTIIVTIAVDQSSYRRTQPHMYIVATVTFNKTCSMSWIFHIFEPFNFIQICYDISELLNTFNRRRAAIQQTCFRKAYDRPWERERECENEMKSEWNWEQWRPCQWQK